MRRTQAPYDDAWAIARLHEVWEWAVRQNRHYVAFLVGMTIIAFEHDDGRGKFKPPKLGEAPPRPTKVRKLKA